MKPHTPVTNATTCYHCGQECNSGKFIRNEKSFCCQGCLMVFDILNENQLCNYYDLNNNPGSAQTIEVRKNKFAFLDDDSIQSKILQFTDGKQSHVTFYLPQMHCSSCLWLLENITKINAGVVLSRVNFPKKEVFIVFENAQTSLRKIVECLTSIGYEPHLSLQEVSANQVSFTDKSKLYKIGIAGFCFGNIMMMSFPEYLSSGDIDAKLEIMFKMIAFFLSLPVLLYCSQEFFISAWKGLKNKFVNIDAPIALAILITFLRSLYEMSTSTGNGYLDSMSGIVFFMLLGRLLQDKTHHALAFDRDYKSFFPIAVDVVKGDEVKAVEINQLKPNDIIRVHAHELIPADAILSKGKAAIDYSFVSGESLPVHANIGEMVYAGGKQLEGSIELMVVKEVSQSYLTNLWNKEAFAEDKKPKDSYIHDVSNYFTVILFVIAGIAAAYWISQEKYHLMWNALTTILIIACPCALLLSSTFTNGNILRIFSKNKLFLRNPEQIEYLSKINHIVLDKTGTLTDSKQVRVEYIGKKLNESEQQMILLLASQSNHPLSQAVKQFLQKTVSLQTQVLEHFKVSEGGGIEAWIEQKHVKLGSAEYVQYEELGQREQSEVYVKCDNEILGKFIIQNAYREGLPQLIQELKKKYSVSILSGDHDAEKEYLTQLLGNENDVLFNQKPADKLTFVENLQKQGKKVLMLGDGLNDAGALRQSDVGIAVSEHNNTFTPASDGILDASQVTQLTKFLSYAKFGNLVIVSSFVLSLLYNVVGLSYAVTGTLSPLIAAILMPASSISIILWTYGLSEIGGYQKFKQN